LKVVGCLSGKQAVEIGSKNYGKEKDSYRQYDVSPAEGNGLTWSGFLAWLFAFRCHLIATHIMVNKQKLPALSPDVKGIGGCLSTSPPLDFY